MPGESYCRWLRSLLLYLCYVFQVLINSCVGWFQIIATEIFSLLKLEVPKWTEQKNFNTTLGKWPNAVYNTEKQTNKQKSALPSKTRWSSSPQLYYNSWWMLFSSVCAVCGMCVIVSVLTYFWKLWLCQCQSTGLEQSQTLWWLAEMWHGFSTSWSQTANINHSISQSVTKSTNHQILFWGGTHYSSSVLWARQWFLLS